MGTGPQKDQVMISSLKLSAPTLHSPERDESLEMDGSNPSYIPT